MLDMWCAVMWTLGTTPDDHYGIYLDGVLWLVIVSETGEAEEERRRAEIVLAALKASPVQTDGSVLLDVSSLDHMNALLRSSK